MLILAVDQGTTGTTTVLYEASGQVRGRAYREITQYYPQPGWVEHDPNEIWASVVATVEQVLLGVTEPVVALGITNQRETTVLWDRATGEPVARAIVWQCRRTATDCEQWRPAADQIKAKTGLPLDAYFSASKIRWLLNNIDRAHDTLAFGTVDSWLLWKLTDGNVHATDFTNASRTLLFNIHQRCWDETLCELFAIPRALLPEAKPSCGEFGRVSAIPALRAVPIMGVAGDQQAALFGQRCVSPGNMKNTYGTGCFAMMNTGRDVVSSRFGLLSTLALNADAQSCYALEGAVYIGGAVVQWLRDGLGIIQSAAETEVLANSLADNGGVYIVPAFVGLGAPHWDPHARGVICGLTRGTGRAHLARAALESMALQTTDVLHAMELDSGIQLSRLVVDGGAVANNFLMQFQADMAQLDVVRPKWIESTSLGAALLAGIGVGMWQKDCLPCTLTEAETVFKPRMPTEKRMQIWQGWQQAVAKTRLS
jgi:glycerol kinase